MHSIEELRGRRFGRLVVLDEGPRVKSPSGCYTNRTVKCHCDCGTELIVRCSNLLAGRTHSCGCLRDEKSRQRLKARWAEREKDGHEKKRVPHGG